MDERPVSEAYSEIVNIAIAAGVERINELPGCWEHQATDDMFIAVNGHKTPMKPARGPELDPYYAYVEIKGWPAAILNPYGGCVMGGTEDELIEMLKAALPAPIEEVR